VCSSSWVPTTQAKMQMAPSVASAAGISRRNRRDQNAFRSIRWSLPHSRSSRLVMRKPESVKNIDTPR